MGAFIWAGEIRQEQFDWGVIGWRCTPGTIGREAGGGDGCQHLAWRRA